MMWDGFPTEREIILGRLKGNPEMNDMVINDNFVDLTFGKQIMFVRSKYREERSWWGKVKRIPTGELEVGFY